MKLAIPQVTLVGWTNFDALAAAEVMGGFSTDADGGQALTEAAGRACYQAWHKPNPATATNASYLRHILEVGHLSVLEHGTATFYLTGVSRSFTHELVRHRHLSYSQLSQRFVPEGDAAMVEPAVIADDPNAHELFRETTEACVKAYQRLSAGLEERFAYIRAVGLHNAYLPDDSDAEICQGCGQPWPCQKARIYTNKQARQAARAVLPNATETRIVVSGNYRAWRHFITMRATEHADVEIRAVAVEILRQLQQLAPNVFGDFTITPLVDGTETAASPYMWES